MKKILKESDIRRAVQEVVGRFLNEHRPPEGGYADYEGEDINWQSVYEQALDYLEGGGHAESARDLIDKLCFRTESFNERDYETTYDACESALMHFAEDNDDYPEDFFENRLRNTIKRAVNESLYDDIDDMSKYDDDDDMLPSDENDWYAEEDYDGNTGKPGMVRSYHTGDLYLANAEMAAEEEGYRDVAEYLRYWASECLPECPWYWIPKKSGYGHNGKALFEDDDIVDGHLVCKEIYDQVMFDAYPPTGRNSSAGAMSY